MANNEYRLSNAREMINLAFDTYQIAETLEQTSGALNSLIAACRELLAIVASQQAAIERLEDVLQNHLKTEPRRR